VDFEDGKDEDNGALIEAAIIVIDNGYSKKGTARRDDIYISEIRRSQLPEGNSWNYHNSLSGLLKANYVKI